MRKRTILVFLACTVSLCFFTGLLFFAAKFRIAKNRPLEMSAQTANDHATSRSLVLSATTAKVSKKKVTSTATQTSKKDSNQAIILDFAGDINFNEGSYPVARYDSKKKGILGGLSSDLVKEMKSANIMMLNNEFAYSTRGKKAANKSFTFRAKPSRVNILKEMGVDIVSLANNHALDYGRDALKDTFKTLDQAGIDYIGAGMNMDRAKSPIYYTVKNKKIAYVAASRVVFATDWYATDSRLGMIGTYDPTLFIKSIREAAKKSDYVIAYLHWGVERKSYPESYQRALARKYIDAGADLVVGCHPHVLQGFEYYKGKPIAYSLGNFWFNNANQNTGLLKLYLNEGGKTRLQILPAKAKNAYTYLIKDTSSKKQYWKTMQKLSYGVTIDRNGFIKEK